MVSIGTSVKRQSTNFYSFLPIGYWLESENWVHFHTFDSHKYFWEGNIIFNF